ncbi:MAG: undecaprenyl-diphosphate phosphatase [Thermoflavifilum sp.]|uniref:undecaprenyl-diphosphate phosphatase n=1 Tax=Thermoflavifilum sp. TaxID=1968839 RepID=UPI0018A50F1F|nr:undecaprenyl-diphosphate phosphatase [Thermoflavifilum sp.]QOR75110.1 MAG: undecaprenyl-diphosphate phosphatase [Thermoflavifilum sp.]
MNLWQAILLGIIEGITEFLPVSSTGHMIIASSWMGIDQLAYTKLFEIVIQLGAILSVVVLYWRKFFDRGRLAFYRKIILGTVPALIIGYLLANEIDQLLDSPRTVGIMLLLGGIVFIWVDQWFKTPQVHDEEKMTVWQAIRIGFWQCLAMIPGVSRSAAAIIGGLQQKLSRELAAEFSFFLAVPTMAAATGYKLWEAYRHQPQLITEKHYLFLLLVGCGIAFLVAMVAIRSFIRYLQHHTFRVFGYYRIVLGIVVLILVWKGILK